MIQPCCKGVKHENVFGSRADGTHFSQLTALADEVYPSGQGVQAAEPAEGANVLAGQADADGMPLEGQMLPGGHSKGDERPLPGQ